MLTEQKLDDIHASLETSPRNLLNYYITRRVFRKRLHEETQNFYTANYKRIVVPGLKKRDQVARILSGITQKQHPQRDFNNFDRITLKLKCFPLLYSVHSVRMAKFSASDLALLSIC